MGHCNDSVVGMAHHTETKLRSEAGQTASTAVSLEHSVLTESCFSIMRIKHGLNGSFIIHNHFFLFTI